MVGGFAVFYTSQTEGIRGREISFVDKNGSFVRFNYEFIVYIS